jgi:hypothetical protein
MIRGFVVDWSTLGEGKEKKEDKPLSPSGRKQRIFPFPRVHVPNTFQVSYIMTCASRMM